MIHMTAFLSCVVIMTRPMSDNEGDDVIGGLFFFFFPLLYPAAVYRGDDDSAISAAVEVLMKSSLCLL